MAHYLGIDVSKDSLDVCLLSGPSVQMGQFDNTASGFQRLARWLRKQAAAEELHACLEATGQYGDGVAEYLYQQGWRVSVVNPARIKAYGASRLVRNKTDQLDARLIAEYCARENPPAWTPPSPEFKQLREMTRHLAALKDMRTQESNRLGSGGSHPLVQQAISEHLTFLQQQIKALESQIKAHINRYPELKRRKQLLMSIPGIGEITAIKILAEIRSLEEFDNARQVAAYAGLSPRQHRSGSSVRGQTRLSKAGNIHLRTALYFPAIVACRHNPLLRVFAERLRARSKGKMVVVGAVMRKLLCLAYGVLKSGIPFDPHYGDHFLATS